MQVVPSLVTQFNITDAIEALGIQYDVRGVEANSLCPMHEQITGKEDRNPSWWINLETGMHICFSCHYKGNLLQLVCDVNQFYRTTPAGVLAYDYALAKNWLAGVAETPIELLLEHLRAIPDYVTAPPKLLPMSEARLAVYGVPPQEALDSRSISLEAVEEYGVLWDTKKDLWILPLREPDTLTLLGWQEKGYKDRYFRNRPAGLQKSKTLFGVNTYDDSVVYLVESPLDCLRLRTAGYTGAVALCGSAPSEEQVKLIRGVSKIYCLLDNDAAGQKGSAEMLKFTRKYGLNLFFFNYGSSNAKDPGEMTDDELSYGITNAISALFGESAYVQGNAQTVSG